MPSFPVGGNDGDAGTLHAQIQQPANVIHNDSSLLRDMMGKVGGRRKATPAKASAGLHKECS